MSVFEQSEVTEAASLPPLYMGTLESKVRCVWHVINYGRPVSVWDTKGSLIELKVLVIGNLPN